MTPVLHPARARGVAPGKVILLGEHVVVYGRAAIAASIDRHVSVQLSVSDKAPKAFADARLEQAVVVAATRMNIPRHGLDLSIETNLPLAVGLGSSAALSVALVRALAALTNRELDLEAICAHAYAIEEVFHGHPSGIDNSVATYQGLIAFQRGKALRPLPCRRSTPLVVAIGRSPRQTRKVVTELRSRWQDNPSRFEPLFDQVQELVEQGIDALDDGDLDRLGTLMNANHAILKQLGVSTDELDAMIAMARAHGALGAKLTGGGGGGAVICLCPSDADELARRFESGGWQAFTTDLGTHSRGKYASSKRSELQLDPNCRN